MQLKISSVKWRPFCLGLIVLTTPFDMPKDMLPGSMLSIHVDVVKSVPQKRLCSIAVVVVAIFVNHYYQLQLEQLERLRSENTPASPLFPILSIHIPFIPGQ